MHKRQRLSDAGRRLEIGAAVIVVLVDTRRDGLWIHYRLGQLADPVMAAIVDAVRHALTHVDVVRRDGERLHKRTGCCVPTPGEVAGVSCCVPQPVQVVR